MTLLAVYLLIALGLSFLCSILEACLLSITPSYVRQKEEQRTTFGLRLGYLKSNIDRPLAAILSLNTIAHTVGAAGVGAQATLVFGKGYFGLISAVLTLLILFVSEIIPKTLGAIYWRKLARFTTWTCEGVIVVMYPLVWISERLTRLIQPKQAPESSVSRDEVVALAQLGESEGVFAENETQVIRNLIRFRHIQVDSIMTPRTVAVTLPEETTCADALQNPDVLRFSRIPVYSGNRDRVTGYVLKHQLLEHVAYDRHDEALKDFKRPIRLVSEKDSLSKLFNELFTHREQIALVVDEYGGMAGIVSMEDLIETLLGLEIVDEYDQNADMQELARKKWIERARKMGLISPEDDVPGSS